jgi:hypothetical protein
MDNVSETKPLENKCSKCDEIKIEDKFIKNRNICKDCRNKNYRENYTKSSQICDYSSKQKCNNCNIIKTITDFECSRKICRNCVNEKRRHKYATDEEHRKKLIKNAIEFKHNKVIERQLIKQEEIGIDNKKCNYCFQIKHNSKFRFNRLKCRDCERDEPVDKFKRVIRSRIHLSLKKDKKTIEYLGCSAKEYLEWILTNNNGYTLENRGKEWHIDHVIPLSKFNLDNENEQLIAFNWRNTMPLCAKENLSKNNKIITSQIEHHYQHLLEYHKKIKKNIPQEFIDLFAKHLVAGSSLEPSLPLIDGNIYKELG